MTVTEAGKKASKSVWLMCEDLFAELGQAGPGILSRVQHENLLWRTEIPATCLHSEIYSILQHFHKSIQGIHSSCNV